MAEPIAVKEFVLTSRPVPWRAWLADVWAHRQVFLILARKEFQTRYKRASFGILWAVFVPLVQGGVIAFVFTRLNLTGRGPDFAPYVMSGVLAWSYFVNTFTASTSAIVDGSGLTSKVWFPRILLAGVPAAANVVSLIVSMAVLVVLVPFLGADVAPRLLLLIPACLLVVAFAAALGIAVSALHVYFRDTRFIVQASVMVWMWLTPIVYRKSQIERLSDWLDLNPMTGIVTLFHRAVSPDNDPWVRSVVVSLVATVLLVTVGLIAQRKYDRLFVDQL